MTPRRHATPRGPQWSVEPRYTWRRDWAKALLVIALILACGLERVG